MTRVCDDAISISRPDQLAPILRDYKLVLICGLPFTGKTFFASGYRPARQDFGLTHWQRSVIMSMLSVGRMAPDAMFGKIKSSENLLLQPMIDTDAHQVLVDGWYSSRRERLSILKMARHHRTCCLVFDGPDELIMRRFDESGMNEYFGMDRAEFRMYLQERRERFVWPARREGFTSIYYVNTFGPDGIGHLASSVYQG